MSEATPTLNSDQAPDEVRWYFQAMEYFALILNRTYTVMVTDRMLCGAYVHGPLPSPPLPTRDWHDPEFYVGQQVHRYEGLHVESPEFRRRHWFNFQYQLREIASAEFDPRPKWGMGNVPYSGRIHVCGRSGWRREFILVGQQAGAPLAYRLTIAIGQAHAV